MPRYCSPVHIIREVDRGSPAELAGVKEGELLLVVNEELVQSMEHKDVVDKIRHSGPQVTITTISAQGQDFFTRVCETSSSDSVKTAQPHSKKLTVALLHTFSSFSWDSLGLMVIEMFCRIRGSPIKILH